MTLESAAAQSMTVAMYRMRDRDAAASGLLRNAFGSQAKRIHENMNHADALMRVADFVLCAAVSDGFAMNLRAIDAPAIHSAEAMPVMTAAHVVVAAAFAQNASKPAPAIQWWILVHMVSMCFPPFCPRVYHTCTI